MTLRDENGPLIIDSRRVRDRSAVPIRRPRPDIGRGGLAKPEKDLPNPETLFLEAQPRLTFGVKAAAYGCGISVRQLDWWTRVGYVPVLQSGRHRRYSANAIKIALL